uniref:Putative nitrophorin n=1 Tax=Panstrongylus lignarius TaxID=156445 RepID=A0A224XY87_9HEMI
MYKSTTALLMVSLLSLSTAGPLTEECQNIKTMQQFDPIKYFGRPWYATHAIYTNANYATGDLTCMKYRSSLLDIDVVREIGVAYLPKNELVVHSESYINLADFVDRIAQYSSVARITDKDDRPILKEFHPLQNNIVDTDYDNYAVVYSCVKIPNDQTFSIYNVLSRDLRVKSFDDKVVTILEEIGLKLDDFTQIAHDDCKEVET